MKYRILFIALFTSVFSWCQAIFTNPITGINPNTSNPYTTGQTVDANLTVSGIGRGAGITGNVANDRYNATGWSTGAIDLTDYFEFTLTPNSGFAMDLVSFVYTGQISSGTATFAFRSSVDGYTANIGSPIIGGATISLAAAAYQTITTPITFRLYGWGGTGGTYSVNDFTFNGTVAVGGIVTAANGDWYTGTTWVGGVVPTSAQNAIVNHTVTASAAVVRDLGTVTTIGPSGTLIMSNATYTTNGLTNVNGTFQINDGGWANGTNFDYAPTGILNFNTTGGTAYTVNNGDRYWPTAASDRPQRVNVLQGGLILNNANRVVDISFTMANGGSLGVALSGTSILTLVGECRINTAGFFNTGNSPVYNPASTLVYNTGSVYGRGLEWTALGAGTIGTTQGYPNNIQLSNNTTLNYNNGTPLAKAINGNLTIDSGSSFYMDFGAGASGGFLTVAGNVTNNGNFTLGNTVGDDLKIGGNFSNTSTGVFNGNNRALYFTKAGVQTITNAAATTLTFPYVVLSGGTTVQLINNLVVSAPLGGNALAFTNATDIFDINGNTLTIGTAVVANTISGAGTFKGSTASNLTLLGTGSIGTLNFLTGFQNLGTLVMNRSAATIGCVMGTPVTINTALTLTAGLIDLNSTTMTLASTCGNVFTASANSYVIADFTAGGVLQKAITANATVYNFPIGDKTGTLEFSPARFTSASGSFASAFLGVSVQDFALATDKHPNLDATTDYISRYWALTTQGTFTSPNYTFAADYVAADNNGTTTNCRSNQWNGTAWTNGGTTLGVNALTIGGITSFPAINHITKGFRNAEINVKQNITDYLDDSTYTFVNTAIGFTTDVTFTIYNLGQQGLTLTPPAPAIVGGPIYTLITAPVGPVAGPLGTTTFTIRFAPTAAGIFPGKITLTTNDPTGGENQYVINFSGTGVTPAAEINIKGNLISIAPGNVPYGLDNTLFGPQNVSTTSLAKAYTIESLGNIPLLLSGATPFVTLGGANPGDFAISAAPLSSINAGTSSNFSITFTPTDGGVRTATVTVASNDSDEPTYTFNIQGTGNAPEIEVYGNGVSIPDGSSPASSANSTNFGNCNITAATVVKTFTVFNTGVLSLNLSSVTITGANASDFTITTSPTTPLATNVSTTLVITFNPTTIGVKNALVTIANNDITENPYTFDLQGNGLDYIECGLGALETIAVQDFEPAPATPTMGYSYTQEAGAGAVTVGGGTARGSSRTVSSNKFIGTQSFQMAGHSAGSTTEKTTTIDFATVDASAFQEVSLNLKVGAYSTNNTQGPDGQPESVKFLMSLDNGVTWSQEIEVRGSSNSIWDINTSTGVATFDYDGNTIYQVYSSGGGSTNTGPRNITISNIPNSSQLKIRILLTVDRTDEIWVIDDVKLQGKKPAIATWTAGAWVPSAPTAYVKSIIDDNYNTATNGNVSTCSCQINAGKNVVIAANQYFDIEDNFTNAGTITVENNGSLVQHNNAAVNSGNIIMKRNASIRKSDYVYWSSPVAGFASSAISPLTSTNLIYKWNPTLVNANLGEGTWVAGNETMVSGKGYIVRGPSTFNNTAPQTFTATFTGTPYNGIVQPSIARGTNLNAGSAGTNGVMRTTKDDNWNLMGNPYPSSISAIAFLTANTNIEGAIRLWTHGTLPGAAASDPFYGNYVYNYTTNDYITYNISGVSSGPSAFNGYIASGQSFFVIMNDGPADATQTVTFTNSLRNSSYNNAYFYRSNTNSQEADIVEKSSIWLDLIDANSSTTTRTLIAYVDGATLEKDRLYDAYIKVGATQSIYSLIANESMNIQGRPLPFNSNDTVPLGVNLTASTPYTIAIGAVQGLFEPASQAIYLEDLELGIVHNLRQAPYSFTASSGRLDTRFVLRYTSGLALNNLDFENANNSVAVASSNGQITIHSTVENIKSIVIYDIVGREVFSSKEVNAVQFAVSNVVLNQQALIVKITLENGQTVTKKIVF